MGECSLSILVCAKADGYHRGPRFPGCRAEWAGGWAVLHHLSPGWRTPPRPPSLALGWPGAGQLCFPGDWRPLEPPSLVWPAPLHPLKCPAPTPPQTGKACRCQMSEPLGRPGSELRGVRSARARLVCVRSNYEQPWARGAAGGSCAGASRLASSACCSVFCGTCDEAACHEWGCGAECEPEMLTCDVRCPLAQALFRALSEQLPSAEGGQAVRSEHMAVGVMPGGSGTAIF